MGQTDAQSPHPAAYSAAVLPGATRPRSEARRKHGRPSVRAVGRGSETDLRVQPRDVSFGARGYERRLHDQNHSDDFSSLAAALGVQGVGPDKPLHVGMRGTVDLWLCWVSDAGGAP